MFKLDDLFRLISISMLLFFSSISYSHGLLDVKWLVGTLLLPFATVDNTVSGQFLSTEFRVDEAEYPATILKTEDNFITIMSNNDVKDHLIEHFESNDLDDTEVVLCYKLGDFHVPVMEKYSQTRHSIYPGWCSCNGLPPMEGAFPMDWITTDFCPENSFIESIVENKLANVCYRTSLSVSRVVIKRHNEFGETDFLCHLDVGKWKEIHKENFEEQASYSGPGFYDHDAVKRYRESEAQKNARQHPSFEP